LFFAATSLPLGPRQIRSSRLAPHGQPGVPPGSRISVRRSTAFAQRALLNLSAAVEKASVEFSLFLAFAA
jgi:hypothetical protein